MRLKSVLFVTKIKMILVILMSANQLLFAEEIKTFLSASGYGTLTGAGIGLASLVFEKKPNESYGNIARGASLGLYAGIIYGWILINQKPTSNQEFTLQNTESPISFFILPQGEAQVSGVSGMFLFNY